jgi:type II secretory pathway pseudopilin PulG
MEGALGMSCRPKAGLALPELLMVILILGLVAATLIPRFVYSGEMMAAECRANIACMNAALEVHNQTAGKPPASEAEFDLVIVSDREHFPIGIPKCPCGRLYEYDAVTGQVIPHAH